MSPTRQRSIAVISARSCSVRRAPGSRKKSTRTVDSRSRPARRAGAFWSAAVAAIGHSSGIIAPAIIRFALTSRQLSCVAHPLHDEKRCRGVSEQRNEIARPGAGERERNGGENGAAPGKKPQFAVSRKPALLDPRGLGESDGGAGADQRSPAGAMPRLPPTNREQGDARGRPQR